MAMEFGLVNWDDLKFSNGQQQRENYRDTFLKLQQGSNLVRVITQPYQYYTHTVKFEGETGFGTPIRCSAPHGECAVCDLTVTGEDGKVKKQFPPKRRWYIGVIDRKTQSFKILDCGKTVVEKVQDLSRDPEWGNPSKYDIDIKVNKQGGATGYYNPTPRPAKPLSEADLEIKSKTDISQMLADRTTPPEPKKVADKLTSLRKNQAKTAGTTSVSTKVDMTETEADDSEFQFQEASV